MKTVHKSVLIWYSAEEMFSLVTDVASYPAFLPWCDRAKLLTQDAEGVTAEIGIAISGIHQSFVTRNTHIPGRRVHLALVKGPFSKLDGEWLFSPLGAPVEALANANANANATADVVVNNTVEVQRACRVDLRLNYSFDNAALSALVGPVFDRIAGSLVDAFVKRAEQVYQ
jgi:ribosome-associated toxin RatA of RatAB toxin-antitoxin module